MHTLVMPPVHSVWRDIVANLKLLPDYRPRDDGPGFRLRLVRSSTPHSYVFGLAPILLNGVEAVRRLAVLLIQTNIRGMRFLPEREMACNWN